MYFYIWTFWAGAWAGEQEVTSTKYSSYAVKFVFFPHLGKNTQFQRKIVTENTNNIIISK